MEDEEEDGRANEGGKEDTVTELAGLVTLTEGSMAEE